MPFKELALSVSVLAFCSMSAHAADLAPQPAEPAAPVIATTYNWTGFYAGLNAGANWNRNKFNDGADPFSSLALTRSSFSTNDTTFAGGGQVGYNYQIQGFVIGVEGSVDYASADRRHSIALISMPGLGPASFRNKQDWLASAGLRLGYAFDRLLVYASGGAGVTSYGVSTSFEYFGTTFLKNYGSDTRVGWTVGAGVEYALTDNWTVGLDYKYYDFSGKTYNSLSSGTGSPGGPGLDIFKIQPSENVLTARLNYKF